MSNPTSTAREFFAREIQDAIELVHSAATLLPKAKLINEPPEIHDSLATAHEALEKAQSMFENATAVKTRKS